MTAKLAGAFTIGLVIWVNTSVAVPPQRITSFSKTAKGQGTLTVGGDKFQITGVFVNLKENGDAEITLFTDLQLLAKGPLVGIG